MPNKFFSTATLSSFLKNFPFSSKAETNKNSKNLKKRSASTSPLISPAHTPSPRQSPRPLRPTLPNCDIQTIQEKIKKEQEHLLLTALEEWEKHSVFSTDTISKLSKAKFIDVKRLELYQKKNAEIIIYHILLLYRDGVVNEETIDFLYANPDTVKEIYSLIKTHQESNTPLKPELKKTMLTQGEHVSSLIFALAKISEIEKDFIIDKTRSELKKTKPNVFGQVESNFKRAEATNKKEARHAYLSLLEAACPDLLEFYSQEFATLTPDVEDRLYKNAKYIDDIRLTFEKFVTHYNIEPDTQLLHDVISLVEDKLVLQQSSLRHFNQQSSSFIANNIQTYVNTPPDLRSNMVTALATLNHYKILNDNLWKFQIDVRNLLLLAPEQSVKTAEILRDLRMLLADKVSLFQDYVNQFELYLKNIDELYEKISRQKDNLTCESCIKIMDEIKAKKLVSLRH